MTVSPEQIGLAIAYNQMADLPENSRDMIAALIARAIRSERNDCAAVARSVRAPKSIGKDKGRHHEAGAQAAAVAIMARHPTHPVDRELREQAG